MNFSFSGDNFLTYEEVCSLTKLSQPTLRRYVKAGKFPQPIKPNPTGKAVSGGCSSLDGRVVIGGDNGVSSN